MLRKVLWRCEAQELLEKANGRVAEGRNLGQGHEPVKVGEAQ